MGLMENHYEFDSSLSNEFDPSLDEFDSSLGSEFDPSLVNSFLFRYNLHSLQTSDQDTQCMHSWMPYCGFVDQC